MRRLGRRPGGYVSSMYIRDGAWDHAFEIAELRVGFGAELFAPKRRFILNCKVQRCERLSFRTGQLVYYLLETAIAVMLYA